jgi:menaquinol-cytochrome c reductase iron-sulfur subunit
MGFRSRDSDSSSPQGDGKFLTRRQFLSRIGIALGGVAAAIVGVPLVGALVRTQYVGDEPEVWRPVGTVDDFEVGRIVKVEFINAQPVAWAGTAAKTAAWLSRRSEEEFRVFSVNCTHEGCHVRWEEAAELFMCPCHGGTFHRNGNVAGGPPQRPLVEYPVRIQEGRVEVRTHPIPITG